MTALPKPGAVVFAKNVSRVARFYEQLLSMSIKQADAGKAVLESDAMVLVIHGIPAHIASTFVITDPPQRRQDTAVKLVLAVPSLADARARAPALGGGVDPASAAWSAAGFTACDGFDPEGNVVQFRQAAA